ncbi:MAG: hypothetical protein OEY33_09625 [Bdellovibrionales bacterium]|nr:hypothetical protein [Bdellovibrionales bacterium]
MKKIILFTLLLTSNLWAFQSLDEIQGNRCYVFDDGEYIQERDVLTEEKVFPIYSDFEGTQISHYEDVVHSKGDAQYIVWVEKSPLNNSLYLNIQKSINYKIIYQVSGQNLNTLTLNDVQNKIQIWCNQDRQ